MLRSWAWHGARRRRVYSWDRIGEIFFRIIQIFFLFVFRWEAGTWWDDAACYTLETFVCEDSTDLLTRWVWAT